MSTEAPQKTLGELFAFKNGRGFRKHEWESKGLPIIRIQNLNSFDAPYNYYSGEYSSDILVERGDLLFSWSGTVGSSFGPHLWDREPGLLNQHIFKITIRSGIDKVYAYYALRQITAAIEEAVSGAVGLVHITKEKLTEFTIPVPPIAEQRRIVGILDEAFAGIAVAKRNAQQNLQNARALFESHLQAIFTQRGDGWVEDRLEAVVADGCTLSYGIVQPGNEWPNGLPIVRPTDLTTKFIGINGLKRVDPSVAVAYKRTTLVGDELLLCVRGSTGIVGVASKELNSANVTRGIVPIRFKSSIIQKEFGYYLFRSSHVQNQIRAGTYGAALMQINIRDLRQLQVTFPPVSRQEALVRRLDSLSEKTQRLASLYQQKLTALDELKKSLLARAFAGELTSAAVDAVA